LQHADFLHEMNAVNVQCFGVGQATKERSPTNAVYIPPSNPSRRIFATQLELDMSFSALQTRDAEKELPALEREWMEAWRLKDRATCERILGHDFLLTSARGLLMSKSQWLDGAMGPFVCESLEWDEIRVRPFGDVAIVHARARQRAHVNQQDWSGLFLLTDVWAWRDNRWQVVSRHGTGPISE
jgi:hypothetical protein